MTTWRNIDSMIEKGLWLTSFDRINLSLWLFEEIKMLIMVIQYEFF